ncbi:MAG: hypothetical protein CL782_04370 [Chloroflexi bacterium]|nr:hypothetical protein [Chloroflexota bacterium]|tara:strand:- start:906 stop:2555 length:1650 start_codon:yes stop_codon:yes gene_type:complete
MISVSKAIAKVLKEEGIEWVSTFPVCRVNNALGEENVPMIMMRDDRYAVALADGFSRVTAGKKIGVCTVQGDVNAAGIQVAYAGLAQAFEDGSPVLCITDGISSGDSENTQFDVTTSLKSVTKWYGYIDKPERTHEFMRRAFTMLRNGAPGPVVIAVPDADAEFDETADPYFTSKSYKYAPDPDDVKEAIKLVMDAKNPVMYIGEGVVYADAGDSLLEFAELSDIPVITTLKAKGIFPESHSLSLGVRGSQVANFLRDSDLILSIGSSLSPGRFSHGIPNPTDKKIVYCGLNELHINKMFPTAHAVLGDSLFTLKALIQALNDKTSGKGRSNKEIFKTIETQRNEDSAIYEPAMTSSDKPINPYRVYSEMMKVLDSKNSFVTHESGNTRDQLSTVYQTEVSRGFLGWGNVSTLGFSLPVAMAAKIASPDRPSILVTGEAGVGYMLGNLEVPVRENIPITVIHISNGGFSGYGPGFWGKGHDPYTHEVLSYETVDMSKMVKELGFYTERITEPDEVASAIQRAIDANSEGKSSYIEFICSQYPVYGGWVK